ncbi:MAG: type II toxin-antitoxin system Phd/YefM family antitoxin [Candidatus Kerfeldbacteria bacterium]|nr:type II toxin-antitoxin system Phd/YefM family antitoxin [Candidatus Kerfeldbacteria bacterium]
MKTLTAMKARQNFGGLLEAVYHRGDRYIIERAGRPMAAVVPLDDLDEWQARRGRLFGMIDEVQKKNARVSKKTLQKEINEAVSITRQRSS